MLLSAGFVAGEYSLIASRKSRIESLAQKGNRSAKLLVGILDSMPRYVAAMQVGITVCGLALGATMEPALSKSFEAMTGSFIPRWASSLIAIVIVTIVTVIVGELVPKYVALSRGERVALAMARPLKFIATLLSPFAIITQAAASLILKPLKIDTNISDSENITREELALLLRAGENNVLEETHANVLSKALRFDKLDAADIMVHRLDIAWIDITTPPEQVMEELGKIKHSRVLVCRGDVDEVVGVLYLHDVVKTLGKSALEVEKLMRAVEMVPETLTLNRVIQRMREARTQILVVADEYGGTSGLITLEDVIEEVFGELEDALEGERAPIEWVGTERISAKADVRYDELLEFLGEDTDDATTETLAQLIVSAQDRVPKLGDSVKIKVGTLSVENMARRRVTRVRVRVEPKPTLSEGD